MPLFNMIDLRAKLRRGHRLVGIDPGEKTLGVALSDVMLMLASPYAQWPRGKLAPIAMELRRLAAREGVGGLVVGLPLSLDGGVGPQAERTQGFARALANLLPIPIVLWDESLSSVEANEMLIAQGVSRAKRRERIDQTAAAIILESYLAHRRATNAPRDTLTTP